MKDRRIIFGIYAGFFLVLLYFMTAAADALLGIRIIDLADLKVLSLIPLKNLVGLVIAAAVTVYFWKGKNGLFINELEKAVLELKKVVTPTKEETKVTTISVFVFVGIMVVVFIVFDLIWSKLSSLIY
ncbi:MAG TPA: preprotein translocase subunit SecE [bacterium]|nr:preprotein translocase subunit SecE [bacterium]HPS29688.1 preprotein translocase subunit SecE [bacterium]